MMHALAMKFTPTQIPDVILIKPEVYSDARGFFYESYSRQMFSQHHIPIEFVQDNHSCSLRGVLRGLHFQIEPKAQAKLVRVSKGKIFDVAVDIRRNSPTFGRYVSSILSAENKHLLYVPTGFAHGFCVLEDGTEVLYKTSEFYSPEHERGIIWNDPSLAIAWPKLEGDYFISDKDKKFPALKEIFHD